MNRTTKLVAGNLLTLLGTLFIAEFVVGLTWTPPSEISTRATGRHPYYGWAPLPGWSGRTATAEYDYAFAHTAQGLRSSRMHTAEKPPGISERIMFLGDSFGYGIAVEARDMFINIVDAALPRTETINTGANGYGQRQQLAILQTLGAALRPDTVVLLFFWNDLEDNLNPDAPAFSITDKGEVRRTDLIVPADFDPLAPRTANTPADKNANKPWRKTNLYKLYKEGTRGFRRRMFGTRPRTIQTPEQIEMAWDTTAELLEMIQFETQRMGAHLLIASIPDYELVDPAQKLKGHEAININIEERLTQMTGELDIDYVNLLDGMRGWAQSEVEPLYYATDRHLTPLGNVAVAELLLEKLSQPLKQP